MNNKPITFRVSRYVSDWQAGPFVNEAQLSSMVQAYIKFAHKYLIAKGYFPVTITLCNGYCKPGDFEWQDDQRELRSVIMAEFLHPRKPETKSLLYLSGCDSPKG